MVREMNARRKCVGNGMRHLLGGKTCDFCVHPASVDKHRERVLMAILLSAEDFERAGVWETSTATPIDCVKWDRLNVAAATECTCILNSIAWHFPWWVNG
jgi:hypothetical protein